MTHPGELTNRPDMDNLDAETPLQVSPVSIFALSVQMTFHQSLSLFSFAYFQQACAAFMLKKGLHCVTRW